MNKMCRIKLGLKLARRGLNINFKEEKSLSTDTCVAGVANTTLATFAMSEFCTDLLLQCIIMSVPTTIWVTVVNRSNRCQKNKLSFRIARATVLFLGAFPL